MGCCFSGSCPRMRCLSLLGCKQNTDMASTFRKQGSRDSSSTTKLYGRHARGMEGTSLSIM